MAEMFSTKGRYALRTMADLGSHEGWVSLGDVAEHDAAHTTAGSGKTVFLNTDDTAVAGSICREVSGKRQQVACDAAMVSAMFVGNLCRTRLSSHLECFRAGFLTQSSADHLLKDGLHDLDGLRLGYLFALDNRRELLNDHSVLQYLLYQSWAHHLAVVGDGIIEGER